ncbi:MAG: ssl1498 family light-harvesting-like protein [Hormoscilla sp. GUM202]|nr:ssl1498 family light-harvesting-like protein [Hormoscilla sp. GM7CHS1pb]MBO1352055.1 ssl1498 family light-harvesting-like protein [Hormoscilla sp. GUM202]
MPYTTEDGGRLNNFAVEPKISYATPPDKRQQLIYAIAGMVGLGLVGGLVFVAYSIS